MKRLMAPALVLLLLGVAVIPEPASAHDARLRDRHDYSAATRVVSGGSARCDLSTYRRVGSDVRVGRDDVARFACRITDTARDGHQVYVRWKVDNHVARLLLNRSGCCSPVRRTDGATSPLAIERVAFRVCTANPSGADACSNLAIWDVGDPHGTNWRWHVQDDFLGGTWLRSKPTSGAWGTATSAPANATKWVTNGTVRELDCVRRAASYSVMNQGDLETWRWWGRTRSGRWLRIAATTEVLTDGSQGKPICGESSGAQAGPPQAPTRSVSVVANSITISWTACTGTCANGSPVTGYEVVVNGATVANLSASTTSWNTGDIGYSACRTLQVRAINVHGNGPLSPAGSWCTPGPGAPSVTVTKGASAQGQPGCTSAACAYVEVSIANFAPGSHTVVCRASDGDEGGWHTHTTSNFPDSLCYYGFPGRTVWVTVDGIESNHVAW